MRFSRLHLEIRISLLYLLFGSLWILVSDFILASIFTDPNKLTSFQTYKGWFFIVISTLLIYTLLKRSLDLQRRLNSTLQEREELLRILNLELEERVSIRTTELNDAMLRAQESDQLKSVFLATMSHELRTPLNSIIGFTGVMAQGLSGPLTELQIKQLGIVRQSSQHLLNMINDILDLSKIEAGQFEIRKSCFNLRQLIEDIFQMTTPAARKKGISLRSGFDSSVEMVYSDRRRVEQIILNLINNAIKFTEKGDIQLDCRAEGNWINISVSDSGMGIKEGDIDQLFKPFRQVDTGLSRLHEGTGLGLSICSHLIHLLGGEIEVQSEWGKGSKFTFTLPIRT
ncbi:MAG: sensor histidine kinase [Flexilinea sp.]